MSFIHFLQRNKLMPVICIVIFLLIVGGTLLYLWQSGFFELVRNIDELKAYIEDLGAAGPIYLFCLQILDVIIMPFIGGFSAIAGGIVFGFFKTFLICSGGIIVGSCINYALARYFGRPIVELFAKKETVDKYLNSFEERKKTLLFIMFFLPGFPDDLLCFVAGISGIGWRFFIFAAVLGRPWGLIISTLLGTGALHIPFWGYIIIGAAFLGILIISWKYGAAMKEWIISKFSHKHHHPKS
ncbi:MAG TPA: TVP38/TMEM64 family protein [Firmicutes bacterium]|nr:TVP38/TMEM64 family protein [Bacillota bacterium]